MALEFLCQPTAVTPGILTGTLQKAPIIHLSRPSRSWSLAQVKAAVFELSQANFYHVSAEALLYFYDSTGRGEVRFLEFWPITVDAGH